MEVSCHAATPPVWIVVFCRSIDNRWVRWLACGQYKHVRAYAYLPALKVWLFYDVTLSGTLIHVAPDTPQTEAYIGEFTRDSALVAVKPGPRHGVPLAPFCCTSAVRHLIGLKSGALRPDRLFRDCLAAGGTLLGQFEPAAPGLCATARRPGAETA